MAKVVSQAVKNKRAGAKFEGDLRSILRKNGQFIYTKGVSSKGIDIFALKQNKAFFIELKTHLTATNTLKKDALQQFYENDKIVDDFIQKTQYNVTDVLYCLIIYERNSELLIHHINGECNIYDKTRQMSIENLLDQALNTEFNNYYDDI